MKTNIFNITALALLISTGFLAGNNTLKSDRFELPDLTITEISNDDISSYQMVKAKVINGEVLPVVELPELTISANYNTDYMVSAQIVDGEVMPVVQLPELEVVGNF